MAKKCFDCGTTTTNSLYGFPVCEICKEKLGIMSDETFNKHALIERLF